MRAEDLELYSQGTAQNVSQDAKPTPIPNPVEIKRQNVQLLALHADELRYRAQIQELEHKETEVREHRKLQQRTEEVARENDLEEIRLQVAREASLREREQHQVQTESQRVAYCRKWIRSAERMFPAWLLLQQRETLRAAVEIDVNRSSLDEDSEMRDRLKDLISRVCAPWLAEKNNVEFREKLIADALSELWRAVPSEKAQVAGALREAIASVPPGAHRQEIVAVVENTIAPTKAAIRMREHYANLICAGIAHVSVYLLALRLRDEIELDALLDFDWQEELKANAKKILERELTGAPEETEVDACKMVENLIDEELE